MRTVIRAQHMGFCFGVKRALDIVQHLESVPVTVLGDLIHNPQEVDRLKKRGIRFVKNCSEITGGTVVISAHGTADSTKASLEKQGLNIVDATCPLVEKIHLITKQLPQETTIVIFGDRNHPEVQAITENLRNPIVVSTVEELPAIKESIALVSQTTQNNVEFDRLSRHLRKRYTDVRVFDTICHATEERQRAARDTARKVGLMLVIGGRNSANTKRLNEICGEIVETHHIETAAELMRDWVTGKDIVGVTAGASTPDWVIEDIIRKVQAL